MVEDEVLNQEIAQIQLEQAGMRVVTAENGAEAVKRVSEDACGLILMDMQMPVMEGPEATRRIRQLPLRRDTPILAMTANAFAEDSASCLGAGMDDFITRPVIADAHFAALLKRLTRGPSAA